MNTFFVGKVDEVRPFEKKVKETGQVIMSSQVTATFETIDTEGYLVKSTQQILLDINRLAALQSAKGKYIVIPYIYITTPKGNWQFADDKLDYMVLDKNPLESVKKGS